MDEDDSIIEGVVLGGLLGAITGTGIIGGAVVGGLLDELFD